VRIGVEILGRLWRKRSGLYGMAASTSTSAPAGERWPRAPQPKAVRDRAGATEPKIPDLTAKVVASREVSLSESSQGPQGLPTVRPA